MFLALREIRRRKSRFAVLGGAVALLVVLLLFFQSVGGALTGALTGALENQDADVVVYGDRARRNPAASVLPPETSSAVAGVDGVAEATGVVQAFTTLTGPDGADTDAVVVGIEPGGPGTPVDIVAGRLPEVAGEALASGSGFTDAPAVGTTLTAAGAVELEVVGEAANASANATTTFYVTTATVAEVVAANRAAAGGDAAAPSGDDAGEAAGDAGPGTDPTFWSWIAVRSDDGVDPEALAERITIDVDGVEALDRAAAVAALPGVGTVTQSFSILYLLLFIVVTIVTGVFFLILTVQKRDALVLLRAVGARRRDIVVPVLLQVVAVVGLGAVLGAAATAGLLRLAPDVFGGGLESSTAVTSSALILGLSLVAALAAVRRVLAIEPAEATMAQEL